MRIHLGGTRVSVGGVSPAGGVSPSGGVSPTDGGGGGVSPSGGSGGGGVHFDGTWPLWRRLLPVGQTVTLNGTAQMSGYPGPFAGYTTPADVISEWNGFAGGNKSQSNVWYSVAASGHQHWPNPVLSIDLMASTPGWVVRIPSASQFDAHALVAGDNQGGYAWYRDGSPCGTHNYYSAQHISAAAAHDGLERALHVTDYAAWNAPQGNVGESYSKSGRVVGFQVAAGVWDTETTTPYGATRNSMWIPDTLYDPIGFAFGDQVSICQHPTTEKIYVCSAGNLYEWNPTTRTGRWVNTAYYVLSNWGAAPSVVDASVTRSAAGLIVCAPADQSPLTRLERWNLATNTVSVLPLTGNLPGYTVWSGLCHDRDQDIYWLMCPSSNPVTSTALYSINPDTGESVRVANIPMTVLGAYTGFFNRIQYFPDLGGVALYPNWESNMQFMTTRSSP